MQIKLEGGRYDEEAVLRALHRQVASNLYLGGSGSRRAREYRVGASVMEILDDARDRRRVIRYVRLDDLGVYRLRHRRGSSRLEGPSRRELAARGNAGYRRIVQRSQYLLLPSLFKRLVTIPDVRLAMNPLRTILIVLDRQNQVRPEMFVSASRGAPKVRNYFTLLQDQDILRPEGDAFVAGPGMKRLSVEESEDHLYSRLLGSVLEKRFDYVREVLKWTMIIPFLEWSNAYYLPAYEAGALLRWRDDDYVGSYGRLYARRRTDAEVVSQTTKVRDAGVVRRERDYWVGEDEIWEQFSKQSDREQLLNSGILEA